jgi:hypothetical protein
LCISVITPRFRNASSSFILFRESLNLFNRQSITWISFAISVICLQTISTRVEIATAEYPLTYYILAEAVVVVAAAAAGVLAIGKRVGAMAKQITLQPYILLQVGVLIEREVVVRGGSVVI